ncbi:MAG: hypothetical protein IE890_08620 [Arcobacter sp.]|nr:hypothetical protein [Arcobacter sp.]
MLYILERIYKENSNKIVIEKIAEAIYKSDKELFEKSEKDRNLEVVTSMKLALLNLIQKQDLSLLEYICKNRKEIEKNSLRKISNTKYINKIDFSYANIAYRA